MINGLFAGLGGFIGAAGRYGVGALVSRVSIMGFPINTLIVNAIGSLFMGAVYEYFLKNQSLGSSAHVFIAVGILGGFTTFSSFSLETMQLFANGKGLAAMMNIGLNLILCFLFILIGKWSMRLF